jgi:hypothetical protein
LLCFEQKQCNQIILYICNEKIKFFVAQEIWPKISAALN